MFVFDDMVEIDDRGMQEVLRAVPGEKLLLAIKGADERSRRRSSRTCRSVRPKC